MNEHEKSLIDLQLDQACQQLSQLIKLGKVLPDYSKIWRDFAKQKHTKKDKKSQVFAVKA